MPFSLHILFYFLNDTIVVKWFCAFMISLAPLCKLQILIFPGKSKGFSSHFLASFNSYSYLKRMETLEKIILISFIVLKGSLTVK